MKRTTLLILLILFIHLLSSTGTANLVAQDIPVRDGPTIKQTKIWKKFTKASEAVMRIAEPLIDGFKDVQRFFDSAEKVVNQVVKNMRIIQNIVDLNRDIADYYEASVDALKEIRDTGFFTESNGDSHDFSFIDSIKHINIMLGLFKESIAGFELFLNLLEEEDALKMDDYNRVQLLMNIEQRLRKTKRAMREEINRINKEIYSVTLLKKETETFKKFFSTQ